MSFGTEQKSNDSGEYRTVCQRCHEFVIRILDEPPLGFCCVERAEGQLQVTASIRALREAFNIQQFEKCVNRMSDRAAKDS